jgi:uncharacterized protein (DUF2062 family)
MNPATKHESLWRRWVVKPISAQLTQGTTPAKIAQAIAFGVTIGVFPLLGTPTLLSLAIGIPLQLNQPVLQVFRELSYPLQLATVLMFMRAGESLFGAEPVPFSIPMLMERFFASPGQFMADFGMIGLYAVTVWALIAPLLFAVIYGISRPLIERLSQRLNLTRHATWFLLGIGTVVAVLLFALTWLLSLKLNNFSFVDVTWSYALGVLAPLYAWLGDGFTQRKVVALTMALLWSLRLGTYLLFRVKRHHPHEDVRYEVLRQNWRGNLARNFFWFFQAQALLIVLLSVPVLLACLNPAPQLGLIEWIGFGVWLLGLSGEALSDAQMQRFKSRSASSACGATHGIRTTSSSRSSGGVSGCLPAVRPGAGPRFMRRS